MPTYLLAGLLPPPPPRHRPRAQRRGGACGQRDHARISLCAPRPPSALRARHVGLCPAPDLRFRSPSSFPPINLLAAFVVLHSTLFLADVLVAFFYGGEEPAPTLPPLTPPAEGSEGRTSLNGLHRVRTKCCHSLYIVSHNEGELRRAGSCVYLGYGLLAPCSLLTILTTYYMQAVQLTKLSAEENTTAPGDPTPELCESIHRLVRAYSARESS